VSASSAGGAGRRVEVDTGIRKRRATGGLLAAVLLCASAAAAACPICLGAGQPTKAQELVAAQQVVLALPTADASQFRVIEVIKGERPSGRTIEGGYPRSGPVADATAAKGKPLLLVRTDPLPGWVILGAIGTEQSGWLRKLGAGKRTEEMGGEDWRARVALTLPQLENAEPLVAELAYGELAAAPYAAMRATKPQIPAHAVRAWLADWIVEANPMAYIIETGRYMFLGQGNVTLYGIVYTIMITLLIFSVGLVIFNKTEKTFIDNV